MTQVKQVIFDMDGLMFDTERLSLECWMQAGKTLGRAVKRETFRETVGRDIADARQIVLGHLGEDFPFEEARRLRDKYLLEHVEEHGTPIKKGLLELLDYLDRAGIRKVVATSTEEQRASRIIYSAGLQGRFDNVVYGNMVKKGKPFPDIFLKAAGELPPAACLVLEDSPAGVEAACRAGMPVILISDLVEPEEAVICMCAARLESLQDVIDYICKG